MAGYYPAFTSNATTNVANAVVWNQWNQIYFQTTVTAANTVYAAEIWQNWNNQYHTATMGTYNTYTEQPPLTENERHQIIEHNRVASIQREQAQARGRAILLSVLDKNQREQLEKSKSFELQVNDRLYRIIPGNRVERLNVATKKAISYFCIHPEYGHDLCADDIAVSQKLLLESDEPAFLKLANETRAA